MDANWGSRLAIFLCVAASLIGCSPRDKADSSGTGGYGGGGGLGSIVGSDAVGLGGSMAGSGTGAVGAVAAAGAVNLGLGGEAVAGDSARGGIASTAGAGGLGAGVTNGGVSAQAGGSTIATGGAAGSPSSQVVWAWGQQGSEGPLADPDWLLDNARGSNEGATAAHPPALAAATPVDLAIDCGAQEHTELSFYLAKFSAQPILDFLVDGALRYKISSNGNWDFRKYTFDVAEGVHTYTFRASSSSDASTSFALDSIVCKKNAPTVASNATVDFDKGFVPPEAEGGWFVDNVIGTYSDGSATTDEAAIHPPALQANTPIDMTFNCGQATHTELSFYLAKFRVGPTLDFLVDGAMRYQFSISGSDNWDFTKYTFDVPQGTHSYTFRAQSASDAATSFALDFLQCKNVAPAVASNATVDFDKGFVPPETGGGWFVDNAIGTYSDGSATTDEAAIHPPALHANTPIDMTFNCGQIAHTELSFYLAKFRVGPTLDFLVDGAMRYQFRISGSDNWDFTKYTFDVPQGTHSYTFRAQSASDAATSFAVDFIQCKNVAPVVASNATVDFDQGFVPPETGGGWFVDNAIGTYSDGSTTADEAAIHPPALQANTPVDMTFNCGQTAHTELSFYLAKFRVGPTLDLLVDGAMLSQFSISGSDNWDFTKYTFDVPQGTHNYIFRAQSANDAATSFAVDFIHCTP